MNEQGTIGLERNLDDRRALLRVAADLRGLAASRDMPADDPEVRSLLSDADALERVASWIGNRVVLL